jgi:uncharacterized membrane protein
VEAAELAGHVSLFKLLDAVERADLQRALERRTFSAGDKIFSLGEPGDSLYIVVTGNVEVCIADNMGSRIVLTVCGSGDFFGELSLFDGGARTADAVCLTDAELLVLSREDLLLFLRQHPDAALDIITTMGQRMRSTDEMLRRRARNINEEMEVRSSTVEKIADAVAGFTGSIPFLLLNGGWFFVWIVWNTLPGVKHFDPYPFGFLTMVVSLEAIFLSIFVLISQNRQGAKDRLRADSDYEVNLKAELEITQLHVKIDFLTEELLARIPNRDRGTALKSAQ